MFVHCPPTKLPDLVSVTQPDGKRFYTTPSGKKLPSVTTVMGAMQKQSILEWRAKVGAEEANKVSKLATSRGNRVHNLAEKYLKNETIRWPMEMPDAVEMFRGIRPLIDNHIDNVHYLEQTLWSEKVGMAGRVDLIAEYDGVLSVIDFKTSKREKQKEDIGHYFAQCTAYALMYEELVGNPIDQIVVMMAVEHEQPLIFVEKTTDYIEKLVEHIDFYRKSLA